MSSEVLSTQWPRVLVFLLFFCPLQAFAQGSTSIKGVVFDEQHAALPGAAVTSRHAVSGLERQTVTGVDGAFELPNLPPGIHDVIIELQGFAAFQQRIDAAAGRAATTEAILKLAPFTDTVQVMPSQPAVDTES